MDCPYLVKVYPVEERMNDGCLVMSGKVYVKWLVKNQIKEYRTSWEPDEKFFKRQRDAIESANRLSEIPQSPYLFFRFKNKDEALMFQLMWSGN